jgi:hypothetical protein
MFKLQHIIFLTFLKAFISIWPWSLKVVKEVINAIALIFNIHSWPNKEYCLYPIFRFWFFGFGRNSFLVHRSVFHKVKLRAYSRSRYVRIRQKRERHLPPLFSPWLMSKNAQALIFKSSDVQRFFIFLVCFTYCMMEHLLSNKFLFYHN